jgi:hypothetical protein
MENMDTGYEIKQFYIPENDDLSIEERCELFEKYVQDQSLLCSICMSVAKKPHTSTVCCDMMVLCKSCITQYYNKHYSKCPTCNKMNVYMDHFRNNLRAQKSINELRAVCIYECGFGTTEIKTLEMVITHQEQVCDLRITECNHCHQRIMASQLQDHIKESCMITCPLCNDLVRTPDIVYHMENQCEERPVDCLQSCGETISFNKLAHHIDKQCTFTMINCPLECGTTYIRKDDNEHKRVCDLVMETCTMCDFQCIRKDMKEHQEIRLIHLDYRLRIVEERYTTLHSSYTELLQDVQKWNILVPLLLPESITTVYKGEIITMYLTELPNHYCDFCPVPKQTIPVMFGKHWGYHSNINIDKCLPCAALTNTKTKYVIDSLTTDSINSKKISTVIPHQNTTIFTYKRLEFDALKEVRKSGVVVQTHHTNIVGCFVTEGPNWKWKSQSGTSKTGSIISIAETNGWVRVKWHTNTDSVTGIINTYRIDAEGYHDLSYIDEDDPRIPIEFRI